MSKATKIQCGQTNARIYREPLDTESIVDTYSNLEKKLNKEEGAIYAGLVTAVLNDDSEYRNGPYYISYNADRGLVSYTADRIPLNAEMNSYIDNLRDELVEDVDVMVFEWGHLD